MRRLHALLVVSLSLASWGACADPVSGDGGAVAQAGAVTAAYGADEGDYQRTVVFIYGETRPGQDMFIRGGIDHDLASELLGESCTSSNYACAIPIQHNVAENDTTQPWKQGDTVLDWYGHEPQQIGVSHGMRAEGTPLDWTTNYWPAAWGEASSVAGDGHGTTPLNRFGMHYWMLDVDMDCSRALPGPDGTRWFEVKSYISNGPGWEHDIDQPGAPYDTINHFARCGMLNVFRRDEDEAHILPLEVTDDPYIVGAGDIGWYNEGAEETARLLDALAPDAAAVFTAGDNIQGTPGDYDETMQEYDDWFGPTWGRFWDKLRPAPGNHDYWGDRQAYHDYFGPAVGASDAGYYSYDVGSRWHVVVLNSNNAFISGRWPAELDWLEQDLEAHAGRHVVAIWHHPRFSSGSHGSDGTMQAYWDRLYRHGGRVVINGHDHHYERFAPQTPNGGRDDAEGIRQLVVGTGGMKARSVGSGRLHSEVRHAGTWGVLQLKLHDSWYEWIFIPTEGDFVDTGCTFVD